MPKITSLEPQQRNKSRVNVYIDGEFFCGMEAISVVKACLKVGVDVDRQTLEKAVFDSEAEVAFSKSLDYLGRAMKTEKEVFNYLVRKEFSPEVAHFVVQKLKGYKYVDDLTYAHMYTSLASSSKGAIRLRFELQKKGVARDVIEKALEQIDGGVYKETAEALAKKFLKNKPKDPKTIQKLQRHLLAKGFNFDEVNGAVRKAKEQEDDWN